MAKKRDQSILDRTTFAVEGIIVVNGGEGQAIVSADPETPIKAQGKRLRELGLDVVQLVKEGYLIPQNNQTDVEKIVFGGV